MSLKENPQRLTFNKRERLKSRKSIETLFLQNKSIKVYPFKLVWLTEENPNALTLKMGVSVSKRLFKSAVKRNLLKRKMRESLRLNKTLLQTKLAGTSMNLSFMILYLEKEVRPYQDFDTKIKTLLIRLSDTIIKNKLANL